MDKIGSCADAFISKGNLSENHEKMFQEVAATLGIEDRNIQAKNSGFLIRFFRGYDDVFSAQLFNRVYLNETCLHVLADEEKRFLMARVLILHAKNLHWMRLALKFFLQNIERGVTTTATT